MSDNGLEIVFVCDAETEENEKVRHYYEGIQRLKEGRLPSSTQVIQTGRIFKKKTNPQLSVVGSKQLLNIKLKIDEGKVWSSDDIVGYGPSQTSFRTFDAITPADLQVAAKQLSFLCQSISRADSMNLLRDWLLQLNAKRVILYGSSEYFSSLFSTPCILRNCDVYRIYCTYSDNTPLSFSNLRLLYRSDFSTHFPLNTIVSWQHIFYSNSSGGGLVGSESNPSLTEGDSVSGKSTVSLGYSHGYATSTEDINPVCRICQVSCHCSMLFCY